MSRTAAQKSKVKAGKIPVFKERINMLARPYPSVLSFADHLGISDKTVGFWLNGDRVPDANNLRIIRDKMGVSIDWLLGYEDIDKPKADTTARLISEYTGLSHDSIAILNFLQKNKGKYTCDILSALNKMLGDELFFHDVIDCISLFFLEAKKIDLNLEPWEDEERLFDDGIIDMVDALRKKGFSVQPVRDTAKHTAEDAGRRLTRYLINFTENEIDAVKKYNAQARMIWHKHIEDFQISLENSCNGEDFDDDTEGVQQHGNNDEADK